MAPRLERIHLSLLREVERRGSLTAAAKSLGLTQSALSHAVGRLEEQLGEKLLRRSGRRLLPTEIGQAVFRYADEIFALGRELLDMVRGRPTQRPMKLIVGVVDVIPKYIAHRLIEPALRLGERVRIVCREATPEQLLAQLSVQYLDVVLADAPIAPGVNVRAYNHLLGETGLSFLGDATLVQKYRRRFPQSLQDAPLLLQATNTAVRRAIDQWLDTLDICWGPVNTLPEAIADPNLAKRGAIVVSDDGRKHLAPVVRFRDEPSTPLYREPLLGEHTAEILGRR